MTAKRNYTPLDSTEHVDPDHLGTGAGGGKFLKDDQTWDTPAGGSGAPSTADYLVGTADAGLSAEIVVGTSPGGELGGTWASPTVDATHSGSAHHAQDHASRHVSGGADSVKLDDLAAPDDNTDLNASTSAHGLLKKLDNSAAHFMDGQGNWSTPPASGAPTDADYLVGTANGSLSAEIVVGTSPGGELGGTWASPTVDATHSGSSHAGVVSTHEAASDPHTGYQKESEKDAANGYAGLNASSIVPIAHLATGTPDGTKFIRDDNTLGVPSGSGAPSDVDYLVGTASGGLSAEIVVGTSPGGELGGTWASPTVDATHSGSAHHTQSHDHSAAGDGSTLIPAHLDVPVEAAGTTEGRIGWDGTLRYLNAYDSVQNKPLSAAGWAVYGTPVGYNQGAAYTTANNLTAVSGGLGGSRAYMLIVPAPMLLDSYGLWSTDTSLARSAEARLYVDRLNNSTTLNFVAGTDATFSFTPSAASKRVAAVSGVPVLLPPGVYWAVLRNTHATQTFGIGSVAAPTQIASDAVNVNPGAIAALGATIDISGGTKGGSTHSFILIGRIMGQAAPW